MILLGFIFCKNRQKVSCGLTRCGLLWTALAWVEQGFEEHSSEAFTVDGKNPA